MPNNNNNQTILSGENIITISPIVVNGVKTGYYSVMVDTGNPFATLKEYRIKHTDLLHALKEQGFVVEEATGNRKYKYLKPNILGT